MPALPGLLAGGGGLAGAAYDHGRGAGLVQFVVDSGVGRALPCLSLLRDELQGLVVLRQAVARHRDRLLDIGSLLAVPDGVPAAATATLDDLLFLLGFDRRLT